MEPYGYNLPILKKLLYSKFLVLVGCNIFLLLCLVEEREGDDGDDGNGCRTSAAWKPGRRKILVFAMSLSQNINFRDKVLLPGRMGRASTLI